MENLSVALPSDDGLALNAAWSEQEPQTNPNILFIAVEYVKQEYDSNHHPQQASVFDEHMSGIDPNMSSAARYSPVYSQVVQQIDNNSMQQVVSNELLVQDTLLNNNAQEVDIVTITDQTTGISYFVDSQLLDADALLDADLLPSLADECDGGGNAEVVAQVEEAETERKKGERRSERLLNSSCDEEFLNCVQQICDKPVLTRARASLPEKYLFIGRNQHGDEGIFAKKFIPKRTQFGPIEGVLIEYDSAIKHELTGRVHLSIDIDGKLNTLDVSNEILSNWMCFVRLAQDPDEQNLILTQKENSLYFTTIHPILPKQELLVGYSLSYAKRRELTFIEPTVHEKDLWQCYECPETFHTSHQLQKHLDEHDKQLNNNGAVTTAAAKKRGNATANNNTSNKRAANITDDVDVKDEAVIGDIVGDEALQCTVCMTVITSNKYDVLRQHLLDHGLDASEALQDRFIVAKLLNCKDCDKTFANDEELQSHVNSTHTIKKPEYKCPYCNKIFANGERIQRHLLVHGPEDSKPLQCDKCHKRFLNNSALACHLKTHLLGVKIFECPICKESFHHICQLRLHVPKHCTDGQYTCPHCAKTFIKYSIISKHIRAFHCERKHACVDCGKTFPTLDKLRMHLLKHSDHREFLCADCGKQFKRKDKLKVHCKRMHSEERENIPKKALQAAQQQQQRKFQAKVLPTDYHRFIYKCHQCLVGFKRRGMLVNHLAKRHPEITPDSVPELNLPILKETKDYYCQYCDKVYKSSSKRKAHILKNHPGAELPLSHRRLDSQRANPTSANVATAGTGGELPNPTFSQTVGSITTRPQACQWCHKQYASKAKLLQHQRKKHADLLAAFQQQQQAAGSSGEQKHTTVMVEMTAASGDVSVNAGAASSMVMSGDAGLVEKEYYHLVDVDEVASATGAHNDVDVVVNGGGDSRLYRLLTIGNNLVPPR